MAFPAEFIDELKARVDLVSVISRRVVLTRKGREHLGLCPFHQEKTPSFTVNEQKGFYHCFGCGAHGSAIDFVMQSERLAFRDAIAALAATAGLPLPVERKDNPTEDDRRSQLFAVNEAAARHYEAALRGPAGRAALDYLRARTLDDTLIGRFRLGFAAEGGALASALKRDGFSEEMMLAAGLLARPDDDIRSPYPRFRNRVMFPIADGRNRIVGFGGRSLGDAQPKYLNTAETEVFHKGRLLYGLDHAAETARKMGTIVVVEGYMDVIGLARVGIDYAVAPLGTALTEEQLRLLWRLVPAPVLCFDPDRAGRQAAMRAADRALPLIRAGLGLRFAFLSTDTGEDPDGVARRYPRQFLERAFADAVPLSDVLFWMETGGLTITAPEDRAALVARLRRRLERVGDPEVTAQIMRAFRDRLWQQGRTARNSSATARGRDPAPPPPVVAARRSRPKPPSMIAAAGRTLLAALINNPSLFASGEDELGALAFPTVEGERLRQALFTLLAAHPQPGRDAILAALRQQGFAPMLADLLDDPLIARNRAIAIDAPAELLAAVWRENLAVIKAAAGDPGEEGAMDPASQQSDASMRRRYLLKQAELAERDDEAGG
jgi:DNA primase